MRLSACGYVYMSTRALGDQRCPMFWSWSYRGLWGCKLPDMVLGTELISSGRAASALSHWGFSGQFCLIFEKESLAYLIIWENIIHYLHTLDGKPQDSSCLPHSLQVIGMCLHTWLLCEYWGSELKSSCLYTDRITCGPGRPSTWYAARNALVLLIFLLLSTPPNTGITYACCHTQLSPISYAYVRCEFWRLGHLGLTFISLKLILRTPLT